MTIHRSSTEIPIKVTLYPTITAGAYSGGDVMGGPLLFPVSQRPGRFRHRARCAHCRR